MQWIIPVFVSWSVLGACLGSCFTAGRISFVAGREGVFPQLLSMLNIEHLTPAPAVMLNVSLRCLSVVTAFRIFNCTGLLGKYCFDLFDWS